VTDDELRKMGVDCVAMPRRMWLSFSSSPVKQKAIADWREYHEDLPFLASGISAPISTAVELLQDCADAAGRMAVAGAVLIVI